MFNVTGVVTESDDPFFFGPKGWIVKDAKPLPFIKCRGALNLWSVPQEVLDQLPADVLLELLGQEVKA